MKKVIGIDLGGTKITGAIFDSNGMIVKKTSCLLEGREGDAVGDLICDTINGLIAYLGNDQAIIKAIGICVPGIADVKTKRVWAPNIPGWENYPLHDRVSTSIGLQDEIISIASDRTCYILGEKWYGQAKGCENAVFFAVGTGIGLGVLVDGRIIHGQHDIVGAIGWMALQSPYQDEYKKCGCFESYASGVGIAKQAKRILKSQIPLYKDSVLRNKDLETLTAQDVFLAYMQKDSLAVLVLNKAIEIWGMAAANVVSLFNPEKVIWGGGVFGPAQQFISLIYEEACKWAQPISIQQVKFEPSILSGDAGLYGSGYLALQSIMD